MLLAALVIFLVVVLFRVQVVLGPEYAAQGVKGRSVSYTLDAPRGTIYDAAGNVLASSSTRYDIIADPTNIAQYVHYEKGQDNKYHIVGVGPVEAARQLAPILDMDEAILGGMLSQPPHSEVEGKAAQAQVLNKTAERNPYKSQYKVIATKVTPEVRREIIDLNITGISTHVRSERLYPKGATAANILGFMAADPKDNSNTVGIAGIELIMEDTLKSTPGRGSVEVAGRTGAVIPGGVREETPAQAGTSIHLSLNSDLTAFSQEVADQTQAKHGAEWVVVVVEEVKTGRILAIGDSGVKAFKDVKDFTNVQFGSHAVKDTYEPGSTGKLITMAAALEKGVVQPLTPFSCPGKITMPNGQEFRDSHEHPTERLSAAGIIAQSSNTCIVQVGDKVKDQERYDLMRAFGWGEKSGIQLPSESGGILESPEKWDGRQRYTTMFGQGVATTPLQVTNMLATIGNGGVRNQSRILDGYTKPDGQYEKVPLSSPQRVISSDSAQILLNMMQGVVSEDGTAKRVDVPGYNVAGKTGTTQIFGRKGYVGSFAGLIPAEDPVAAILVVTYRPKTTAYGSVVAVPAFNQVAQRTMQVLGVPPSTAKPELYPVRVK
ncbi:hypothetical protein BM477_04460 [Boudabousia marimammalium]|uniref:Peptidoglycan glycosyltransferase n=1 Tax=Boudabousia marimammalium TaxID=156892 RepID=A0A1Q5PPB3_9ACTO|nr:hypothetical protein BM477_04460 [Boudabousia marimammalium]